MLDVATYLNFSDLFTEPRLRRPSAGGRPEPADDRHPPRACARRLDRVRGSDVTTDRGDLRRARAPGVDRRRAAHPNQHSLAAAMYDAIERATQDLTVEQALACFRVADVPAAECISMDDHFDDAQVQHSELYRVEEWPDFGRVRTVRYPATFGTWGHIAADGHRAPPRRAQRDDSPRLLPSAPPRWDVRESTDAPDLGACWGMGRRGRSLGVIRS